MEAVPGQIDLTGHGTLERSTGAHDDTYRQEQGHSDREDAVSNAAFMLHEAHDGIQYVSDQKTDEERQ